MEEYKNKYLKYKNKYVKFKKINIKNKMNGGDNSIIINPEIWKNIKIDEKDFLTLHNNSLFNLLIPSTKKIENYHIFSNKLKTENIVSNQKNSGRCWMFAGLNVIRNKFIKDYNLKNSFQFSQNYLFFWDKLERMNYIINLVEKLYRNGEEKNSRKIENILGTFIEDGGTWSMLTNLIKKYGLVPDITFPETYHSNSTDDINTLLKKKIKEYTRDIYNESLDKKKAIKNIYILLVKFFGRPPNSFDWEYIDKKDKYQIKKDLSPEKFMKLVKNDLCDYVYLINDPRNEYGCNYSVEYLNNMEEGNKIKYLNVDMETMKNLVKKSIDKNEGVYFACDVGKYLLGKNNIMDPEIYKMNEILDIDFDLTKKERLMYYDTQPTHAMVITGYNKKEDKINRWQIENSWGEETTNIENAKKESTNEYKGYYSMTDKWMDEYVFEVGINKKYVTNEIKKKWNENIKHVYPLWDPFGSLA